VEGDSRREWVSGAILAARLEIEADVAQEPHRELPLGGVCEVPPGEGRRRLTVLAVPPVIPLIRMDLGLSETAVGVASLEALAEEGIGFTILEPHQVSKCREIGATEWSVANGTIDPTKAYRCNLPSGRSIAIFLYDGPISRAVAFEHLLARGENFAHRLVSAFSDARKHQQLVNIATDGETYGHHHRYGDMALAYALQYIEE